MAKPILADLDFGSVSRITNLPDAVSAQQPATLAQVNALIEGLSWKDSVRCATTGNINLSAAASSYDGVTPSLNDRILVKDQTTASQNGIYVYPGIGSPLTRAADASTFAELESAVVSVEEGTANAGTTWRQSAVNGVIDTNSITFVSFNAGAAAASETVAGIAEIATQAETDAGTDDLRFVTPLKFKTSSLSIKRYAANLGDGSATQFDLTHNLNSLDVTVEVIRNSDNKTVMVEVTRTSANVVRLNFTTAPASNAYRCVIKY